MRTLAGLVVALLFGCSPPRSRTPTAPEEASVRPLPPPPASAELPPASSATQAASVAEKPLHPGNDQGQQMAAPTPAIGDSCADDPRRCGKSGKVSVVRESLRTRRATSPCTPVEISSRNAMPNRVSACIDGERVFIASTCVVCRIPTENRILGLVSDMTAPQLDEAQGLAELPKAPALTTIAAWKSAIDRAQKRAQQP